MTTTDDDLVVLLDAMGEPTGAMPKLAAHRTPGHWHAAFSAMLLDDDGRMLLQRRAVGKYHFGGRWTNSCCSHPRPTESLADAVRRRVPQELGVVVDDDLLHLAGSFWYRADDPATGLVEREYDRVVVVEGVTDDRLAPDPDEVDDLAWVTPGQARRRCRDQPDTVTPWLHHVLDVVDRWRAERPD